jgi:hypothetical protein
MKKVLFLSYQNVKQLTNNYNKKGERCGSPQLKYQTDRFKNEYQIVTCTLIRLYHH